MSRQQVVRLLRLVMRLLYGIRVVAVVGFWLILVVVIPRLLFRPVTLGLPKLIFRLHQPYLAWPVQKRKPYPLLPRLVLPVGRPFLRPPFVRHLVYVY